MSSSIVWEQQGSKLALQYVCYKTLSGYMYRLYVEPVYCVNLCGGTGLLYTCTFHLALSPARWFQAIFHQ